MTFLRSVLLVCGISFGLSAGTVVGDQFSMTGTFGNVLLGADVTSVDNTDFVSGSQHISFGIGTNLDNSFQFPDDSLQVWIQDFEYDCTVCEDFNITVDAQFDLSAPLGANGWAVSSAGDLSFLSGPFPSLAIGYGINPPPELGNANFTTPTYSFSNSGPLGLGNRSSVLDFRFSIFGRGIGNSSMPGQGFLLQTTTPEPGGLLLLTAAIALGFGARRWMVRKRG